MCLEPATLTTLAISAVSAVGKYGAEKDAADKQEQYNANQRTALQLQREGERMDAERQRQQEYEVAASSTNEHAHQAMRDLASFDAIAGESGGGVSFQRHAAAIGIQQGQDLATLDANSRRKQAEIGFSDIASQGRASRGIAAIQSVKQPSLLEAGLTIAGAGVNAYTKTQQIKNAKGTS